MLRTNASLTGFVVRQGRNDAVNLDFIYIGPKKATKIEPMLWIKVSWKATNVNFYNSDYLFYIKVRHAEDLGVSPTDASFLIGYLSVASTVGRLFFGKMADLSCVSRVRMYQIGVFAIGLCSFLVTLATGYGGLIAYAVAFGFFEASFVLLIPLVTSDIVGAEKMSYALGSAFTVMAFPMFLGPPIAGTGLTWQYFCLN